MKNNLRISILIMFGFLLLCSCSRAPLMTIYGKTMGTWYTVKVHGVKNDNDRERLQLAIDMALEKINLSVNTYNPDSEISKFNALSKVDSFSLSKDFMRVARIAKKVYDVSGGAFDPTVKILVDLWGFGAKGLVWPTDIDLNEILENVGYNKCTLLDNAILKKDPNIQLDFSAIAKGYGVDLVLEEIAALGYDDILVEIGGEVRVLGKNGTRTWKIGIAVPSDDNIGNVKANERLELHDIACATSGDYQQFYIQDGIRYSHLINPKTGYPIRHEVTSVTVIAKNCMLADACATAAIVLGKDKGLAFIESMEDVEAYFIYRVGDELKTIQSQGWEKQ